MRQGRLWVPALLYGGLSWGHRWICDDGFIYFRVADNLLSGWGPVFNPGERVEAFTSPLWLGLVAACGAILKPLSPGGLPPFEWIAVGLGAACSIGAYVAASAGAMRLWRSEAPAVPVGGLVVLGLVPFWDFGTSGLESSLVLIWLGLSFAGMVFAGDGASRSVRMATAVCIGLGPLVRPELGIFSLLWGCALLLGPGLGASSRRSRLRLAAASVALPLAYELFRAGYFGCLVPNTAIAKEASVATWSRGWLYFLDFEPPYQLWIPLLALGAAAIWALRTLSALGALAERRATLVVATTLVGGLLDGLYVTRAGGDFLHARMLLPALFALTLPTFWLPLSAGRWLALPLLAWAVGCLAFARVQPDSEGRIERARSDYLALSGDQHPVTDADHRGMHWDNATELLENVRAIPGDHAGLAWFYAESTEQPFHWAQLQSWVAPEAAGLAAVSAIGMFGYQARQRIFICDRYGLADPFGARLELPTSAGETTRGKVGHEKYAGDDWCLGHLVESLDGRARYSANAGFVRSALACGDLAELQAAVDEPLGWRRFWRNVRWSPRLTRLRIPRAPIEARDRFCVE